jgi:transcription elongation factor GreB
MAPYITREGEQRLRSELDFLWRDERPRVTQSVTEAAAQGDRSENAEYTYGKKRLREIDSRVRFLRKRLEVLNVVSSPPSDTSKAYFGAWVDLEDDQGTPLSVRLVGPDELDPALGHISVDSVLGRALLGKPCDSEISILTPSGERHYVIIDIRYVSPADRP